MKKVALLLIFLTIISKIVGFGRELSLSYFYGTSNISDAYLISLTIPTVIFAFIGSGISTGYIPMYSKIEKKHGEKAANKFTSNLISLLLLLSIFLILLGLIFTDQIVKIFASGFEDNTFSIAVNFTKISLLGIYFMALVYIFKSFLQIKGNHAITFLVGFPMNICIILSIFFSYNGSIRLLPIGIVLATAAQFVFLLPFIYKKGYRYKPIFKMKDEHIKNLAYLSLPVILGVAVNEINVIVDRTLASQIAVGGISALNYANRLNDFVHGIFVTSIFTVMYPILSKMATENNITGFKRTVSESISGVNLLVIPATVGSMIFAEPIVKLLFARGEFDARAVYMTSNALFYYSLGMIGFGLRQVLSRAFFSLQDTKTPMFNATLAVVINIVLNIILSSFLGLGGLALATSISALISTALLLISLRKKIGPLGLKKILISLIKVLFASFLMGVISKISFDISIGYTTSNISLFIAMLIGVISYFTIIIFMKIEDIDSIVNTIKRKIKKT